MVSAIDAAQGRSRHRAARPRLRTGAHSSGASGQPRSAARRSPSACSGGNCPSRSGAEDAPDSTISRSTGWLSRSKIWIAVAPDDRPVAFFEIGDALGPRRQRKRVRAEVILALAIADGQRRAHARADDQVGMVAEQEGDGEGAVKARQHGRDRILRRRAALDLARDQMARPLRCRFRSRTCGRRRSARRAAA